MANTVKSKGVAVKQAKRSDSPSGKYTSLKVAGLSQAELTWQLLGGKAFLDLTPKTNLEFYNAIKKGVPKLSIDHLAQVMNIPMTMMAPLLNLSYKTLTRKNKAELLDSTVSSHTYEIAETIAKGLEVFEDTDRLNRWLHKNNRALKGAKPFDLLDTQTGIKLVNQILGRIEEGVYS
jgi:putative toxin-antitoxin system antitoxin component (TIGR02293 family)